VHAQAPQVTCVGLQALRKPPKLMARTPLAALKTSNSQEA
jgi:hypothetical protein